MNYKKLFGSNLKKIRISHFGEKYTKNSLFFSIYYPNPGLYYETGTKDKLLIKKLYEISIASRVNLSDFFYENFDVNKNEYKFIPLSPAIIKILTSSLIKMTKISLELFAEKTDINLRTLHRIINENLYFNFDINSIEKIANFYNLDLNTFLKFMELSVQDYPELKDMQLKNFKELVENENLVND